MFADDKQTKKKTKPPPPRTCPQAKILSYESEPDNQASVTPLPPPPFTWTRDEATGSCSRSPGLRSAPPRFPPPEKRRRIWRRLQHDAVLPPRRRIGLRGLILVRSPSVGVAKLAAFCRFATVRAEPRCGRFFSATHRHAFGTQNGFGRGDVVCHPGKRTFVS